MQNITKPRTVSFEEGLRNLASRLTGKPTAELPRTQEAIVQYMAENVPSVDDLAEAITQEVMARLSAAQATPENTPENTPEKNGSDEPPVVEPKKRSKTKTTE